MIKFKTRVFNLEKNKICKQNEFRLCIYEASKH